jgi:hypothetical protein
MSRLVDLDRLARELGITPEQATTYLLEAIAAGFLRVVADDGEHVILEGVVPDEVTP